MQIEKLIWTEEKIKRFWDYESKYPENYFSFQLGKTLTLRFLDILKKSRNVLDYGCGNGYLIKYLLETGVDVYGTDLSEESLNIVNLKYKGYSNFHGALSLKKLIASHKKFDLITLIEVFEHLSDDHLEETLKNIKLLLFKDEGVAIITTPNDEDLLKSNIYCPECSKTFHRWQHLRSWSKDSLTSYLASKDFKILEVFTTNFFNKPRKNNIDRIFYFFLEFIKFRILKKIPPPENKDPHLVCIFKV